MVSGDEFNLLIDHIQKLLPDVAKHSFHGYRFFSEDPIFPEMHRVKESTWDYYVITACLFIVIVQVGSLNLGSGPIKFVNSHMG